MRGFDLGVLALAMLPWIVPDTARADRVTVKGTVLEGTVESIGAKAVVLETVYGKGKLSIALEDVEAIETEADFHVFHGDDVHTVGRVVGTSPDAVRITGPGAEIEIPYSEVWDAARDPGPDAATLERLPVQLPYWSGNLDLAFGATQATTETTALSTGLGLRRERGPSRLRLEASYQRATTRDAEDDESTADVDESDEEKTADELRGFLRQEYDLDTHYFAFGSLEAEHDGIEELQVRAIPKAGLGYVVHESDDARFVLDAGGAFVYERFYDDTSNSYPAVAFGAEKELKLPFGATWHTRLDYTPSLTDWTDDYQLRGETALLVPMTDGLSLKASVVDLYNSSPSDDTQSNSLSTLLGLSLGF